MLRRAGLLLGAAVGWAGWAGSQRVLHPRLDPPEPPPPQPHAAAWFPTRDGLRLAGWFLPTGGDASHWSGPCVILAHSHGGQKGEMLPLVPMLHARGLSAFVFDFRGHGQSEASATTLGAVERWDVVGASDFLILRGAGPLGVLGWSMGGMAAIAAGAYDVRLRAVAAESPLCRYPTPVSVGATRMGYPAQVAGLVGHSATWVASFRARTLLPDHEPRRLVGLIAPRPVLLIGTKEDPYVPERELQEVFAHAGEPRWLWIVEGEGHRQASRLEPSGYAERVGDFFEQALSSATATLGGKV